MKINWGTGIAIFMAVYMLGIIGVVIFSFQSEVNLVTKDYYQQELEYEDQIQRINNANRLAVKPTIELNSAAEAVLLTFPPALNPDKGSVLFFRPSDFTQDKKYKLSLGVQNTQVFDFADMAAGMWKVKLLWEEGDKSYFKEFVVVK